MISPLLYVLIACFFVGLCWFIRLVFKEMILPALRGKKDELGNYVVRPYFSR